MTAAVKNYASYRHGAHATALGRFVVPVARLGEFEEAYASLHSSEQSGWRLSVLAGRDLAADWQAIKAFNTRQSAARILGLECKAETPDDLKALSHLPPVIEAWIEVPGSGPLLPVLEAIAATGRGAKIRTGGTTPEAFPHAARVVDFLAACQRLKLPAKATAGLHHPITGSYPLTYDRNAPVARMFGFVNLVLAAAHLHSAGSASSAGELLDDSVPENFRADGGRLLWRSIAFSAEEIRRTRQTLVRSFGSCSFVEPIEGLQSLGWL